jgi:hypothetical protein
VPGEHVHIDVRQDSPVAHVVPQPPQFAGSLVMSTQAPEHAVSPGLHPPPLQVPELQTSPAAHA